MYYFIFPFIYKKINNKFYYLDERQNKLINTKMKDNCFNTKMSLSIFMKYGNYELIDLVEKNKSILNKYFEYLIKEYTNG